MSHDPDFQVLGEEPRNLPRKILSWFGKAVWWTFLVGLGLYLLITALSREWTELESWGVALAAWIWLMTFQIKEELQSILLRLKRIEDRLQVLYGLARNRQYDD